MRGPEFSEKPKVEKIRLPAKRGWLKPFGALPWKIHYYVVGKRDDNDLVSVKNPAIQMITPNTGGGYSLSLYLHYSIPEIYKHILAYHELREAEIAFLDGTSPKEAHPKAVLSANDYARQHLTPEQFIEFKKWEKALLDKVNK